MALDPVVVDAYYHAKSRCNNPKNNSYKDYGGRGIKFLLTHPWQLYALLGERPKGHQLAGKDFFEAVCIAKSLENKSWL